MSRKLEDEITNDPLARGYSAMTDAQLLTSLNAADRSRINVLSMTEVREWAAENSRAFNLRSAITTGSTDQVKNLAIIGDQLLATDDGKLDPDNAVHVAIINELVADGVWSAADKTALIAKATESISRATEIGLGVITEKELRQHTISRATPSV